MYLLDKTFGTKIRSFDHLTLAGDVDLNNLVPIIDQRWHDANWLVEPPETHAELLKQRAQQLRDEYGYLILYYSGGSDSRTILNTFMRNNIRLDHVVISRFPDPHNIQLNFDNHIKTLRASSFAGKITVIDIDIGPELIKQFGNRQDIMIAPQSGSLTRRDLAHHNMMPEGVKRPCHIWGFEKAVTRWISGEYFGVIKMGMYINSSSRAIQSENKEDFFTAPSFPQLYIKECYILMRYLQLTGKKGSAEKHAEKLTRDPWDNRFDYSYMNGSWHAFDVYGKMALDNLTGESDAPPVYTPPPGSEWEAVWNMICKRDPSFHKLYLENVVHTHLHNLPAAKIFHKYGGRHKLFPSLYFKLNKDN